MRAARLRLTMVTAALCAAVVVVAAAAQPPSAALRLPDLVQERPSRLDVRTVAGRVHLGFRSAVFNAGSGPLRIEGGRPSRSRPSMTATQLIEHADGTVTRRERAGELRYARLADHAHWHLLRFDRYILRRPGARRPVVADRKSGFCLGDRYPARLAGTAPSVPRAQPRFTRNCGLRAPRLLRVTEGISVGYGDNYEPHLEGQYLDITGLPAGAYELVHRVNADGRLLEERYDNNEACLGVVLAYPRGPRAAPTARGRACRR